MSHMMTGDTRTFLVQSANPERTLFHFFIDRAETFVPVPSERVEGPAVTREEALRIWDVLKERGHHVWFVG